MQSLNDVQPLQTYGKNEPTVYHQREQYISSSRFMHSIKIVLNTSIASTINTALFCSIFFPSSNLVPHLESVPPQLMDGTYQTKLRSQLRLCVPCLTLCFAVFRY